MESVQKNSLVYFLVAFVFVDILNLMNTPCSHRYLMHPRNIVDFGAIQIVCVFVYLITCFLLHLVTCFLFILLLFSFLIYFSFIFSYENGPTLVCRPDVIRGD